MAKNMIQGGKKGSGRAAVEGDDTLRSKAYARILDAISEGEIEGFVTPEGVVDNANPGKAIYLDGTVLQASDGTFNFEGVEVTMRAGTQGQGHIAGFPAVENEVSVGVEAKKDQPVVRTITNANIDALRVKVLIPQLSKQDKKTGDLGGSEVKIAIEVQPSGGTFKRMVEDTIKGKSMSRYERGYRIALEGSAPWTVRLVRETADSDTASEANQTWLSSITEIVDAKLSYPNTALVGLRVDASQFSSIPSRAYRMRLLRIRVPSNYEPTTRTYTGAWDGTFKIAWSNNPAWCFYDMLTSERYGLGQHVPDESLDKWALYQIGRYCDEMVPDGRGGTEPRFELNCYLQTREDAYRVLNDMAGAFRGMLYWASGMVVATQDAPADATYLFTNANVIEGEFSYSGVSVKQRHTVAHVSWNDMTDLGRQKVEYVEDAGGVERYGVVQTEVTAFGCTSQSQAHRVGRWMLASELTETETVGFSTGMEGVTLHPGQVIKVRDNYRHGTRLGGRIAASTNGTVTLDSPVSIELGKTYKLFVIKPDGKVHESAVSASGAEGAVTQLNLSTPMSEPAQRGSTWILNVSGSTSSDKEYRVISVSEKEEGIYEVVALEYNRAKYAAVDNGTKLDTGGNPFNPGGPGTGPGTNPALGTPAPKNPKVTITPYSAGTLQKWRVSLSWERGGSETDWEVESRYQTENPAIAPVSGAPLWEIADSKQGYLSLAVRAVGANGVKSAWVRPATVFVGKRDFENVISYVNAIPGFLKIRIVWQLAPELADQVRAVEVWGYNTQTESEPRLLSSTPTPTLEWTHDDIPSGVPWNYRLRAVDQFGNYSAFFPEAGIQASALTDVKDLLNSINESITSSEFFQELGNRIDSITPPDVEDLLALIGSGGEIEQRIAQILSALQESDNALLRNVIVAEEVRAEGRDAMASVIDLVSVVEDGIAMQASRITALSAEVDDANALILTEQTARADGDSALASQITALNASVGSTQALIATEQTARADGDSALASQITAMRASVGSDINAAIVTEQTARANGDSALASQITALDAKFIAADDTIRSTISSEQTTRANADSALATSISALDSKYSTKDGEVRALIVNEAATRASQDAANATSITQVSSRLNNIDGTGSGVTVEQKFASQASRMNTQDGVITSLGGKYSIKIDNQGYVTGFGLASTANNAAPYSEFYVRADSFAIGSPEVPGSSIETAVTPFAVYTTPTVASNGKTIQPGVYVNGNLVASGTIDADKIDARGLVIRDTFGNPILGSGAQMNWSYLTGQPSGIYNSNISIGSNGALNGAGGGQVTLSGMGAGALATKNTVDIGSGTSEVRFWNGGAYETMKVGDFVNKLTKIDGSNIGTFMTTAAIGTAYIGNLAVNTAKIADNSVSVMNAAGGTSSASTSLNIPAGASNAKIFVVASKTAHNVGQSSGPGTLSISGAATGSVEVRTVVETGYNGETSSNVYPSATVVAQAGVSPGTATVTVSWSGYGSGGPAVTICAFATWK